MPFSNTQQKDRIEVRYRQACEVCSQWNGVSFFSDEHKKTREWHVLGTVRELLLKGGLEAPVYADAQEAPDFLAFTEAGLPWAGIEIVEVLRPGYRRHESYKTAQLPGAAEYQAVQPPLAAPWEPLRDALRKKAGICYGTETCLVVYFDIGRFSFADWHTPFHRQLCDEHHIKPFEGLNAFTRVFVLSSDMACLVQLYPTIAVVVPDIPH
jgi:hypothetical protein